VNKGGSEERGTKKYNKGAILNSQDTTCVYKKEIYIGSVIG
jgi:hypothetical protein